MKRLLTIAILLVSALPVFASVGLDVHTQPHGGAEWVTDSGQTVTVTRLAFLLSNFRLQTEYGPWIKLTGQYAYIDASQNRLSFRLENVPSGTYKQIAFTVGLDEKVNYGDPSQWPADHPLNPLVNTLHWSWQGGYVFFALEGHYNGNAGFSLHLAKPQNRTRITMEGPIDLHQDGRIDVALDVPRLLNGIRFAADASATHSRDGDALAVAFRENVGRAFSLSDESSVVQVNNTVSSEPVKPVVFIAANATPYHFRVPAGFPIPSLPRDNPLTVEGVALGKRLFNEKLLSRDDTLSCASCHQEAHAFGDSRRFSVGVDNLTGTRHAMPLFNLAWKRQFFWDGRALSLRQQVLMPIQDNREMHEPLERVVDKLKTAGYADDFSMAFGTHEIDAERVARALEQYVLTLVSFDSKFDRALKGQVTLSEEEKRGFQLFVTEYDPRTQQYGADCFHCHGGPLFSDFRFTNNGLDAEPKDNGRERVTGSAGDKGKFAVPSLRNVAVRGPYMHDGRFKTLEEAVDHYCTGTKRSATLDPNLAKHPDGGVPLSADDKKALVAFLKTLTDSSFESNPPVEPPVTMVASTDRH
jgi:cytochrome c peroxidase